MPNELISFRLTPSEIGQLAGFKLSTESNSIAVKRLLSSVISGHQHQVRDNVPLDETIKKLEAAIEELVLRYEFLDERLQQWRDRQDEINADLLAMLAESSTFEPEAPEEDPEEDPEEVERLWQAFAYREERRLAEENLEWWAALGVDRDATLSEVKAAYYAIAKASHPDITGSESEIIRVATKAWNFYRNNVA